MGCSSSIEQSPSKIKKLQASAASGIEVSHASSTLYKLDTCSTGHLYRTHHAALLDTCIGLIML